MPTIEYKVTAFNRGKEFSGIAYTIQGKDSWIEFFRLLKYTDISVKEKNLVFK